MADDSSFPLTMANGGYDPSLAYAPILKRAEERAKAPIVNPISDEQVAQRQAANQQAQNIAMMSMLSGDEQLQGFGAKIFKQALADKEKKVTDRGTYDPMSQRWTLDPAYQREQAQGDLDKVYGQIAHAQSGETTRRATQADSMAHLRASQDFQAQENARSRAATAALYAEKEADKEKAKAGGQGDADERKSASLLKQAAAGFEDMKAATLTDPESAKPGWLETGANLFLPGKLGEAAAFASMDPQRQRYSSGVSSFSEAVLRIATGAGVGEAEARQKINELTPRPGEDEASINDKQRRMLMYLDSIAIRAGRALPKDYVRPTAMGAPGAPGAGDGWEISEMPAAKAP